MIVQQVIIQFMGQIDASEQTAQLVAKAMSGNRIALERLAGIFHEDVFRMVYYRTRSTMDAEDITQDIFIQAFKNLSRLRSTDRFKSWLFSIAVNRVRDFYRKKRFQQIFSPLTDSGLEDLPNTGSDENPEALDNIMRRDFWKQVELLLDKLSKKEREVFLLRFMDHLSIKEVSQVMKKSESTVKTHLYRALQKFRKEPSIIQFLEEEIA